MQTNAFKSFSFQSHMDKVIEQLQFKKPTDIQEKVIPLVLDGKSVVGQSHTGSGKTHAYLLPLFSQLDAEGTGVKIVITAPTRELSKQIHDEVKKIIQYAGRERTWTSKLVIGGTDKKRMGEKLQSPPDVIVGTPGRILDYVMEGTLSIYNASSFVVDEADLMLDLGFIKEIDQLLVRCKKDIQTLVFSATVPQRLKHFFKKYLIHPTYIQAGDSLSPETITHQLIDRKHRADADTIYQISEGIQPYLALIFTNGKEIADTLQADLLKKGLSVGILHGGLSPRERNRILKEIQQLRYQYIVVTDLASRGIDIEGVSHVINAQLPHDEEFYIHRVGRTARAGLEGTAISLYDAKDVPVIKRLTEKGITFNFVDIKNGEWKEAKAWNERHLRTKNTKDTDKEAWKYVRKNKKVKPGYKKKMKKEHDRIKKNLNKRNGKKH
ncbi:MAG TPA: DEAD/DEAH box helicase [Virgibacillus sp.]|nr:DEAD/DEAH box helicase [Virgibacillus sp.]